MMLSREAAIAKVAGMPHVTSVERTAAKLMAWKEFARATGCRFTGATDEQAVWVVGIAGTLSMQPHGTARGGAIVIDAASGRNLAGDLFMVPMWPDYWDSLPDAADQSEPATGGESGLTR